MAELGLVTLQPVNDQPPKFSQIISSSIVTVTVGASRTFYLHSDLLIAESTRFSKHLMCNFKEADEKAVELVEEDSELFGFFVEYLYRDCSILSRDCSILSRTVQHYSEYVTLARLYAMGERLSALKFKTYSFWRFVQSLGSFTLISDEIICELLRIACTEIVDNAVEDPMRAHIFWYAGLKIANLQKFGAFHQLLCEIPDLGRHLCLWIGQSQPAKPEMSIGLRYEKFAPESEYSLQRSSAAAP